MVYTAILLASSFLLFAFVVERFGRWSGVPSVVVLIATGVVAKPTLAYWGLDLGQLGSVVSVMGTIGLVLIVLEGALDLELSQKRLPIVWKAAGAAGIGFAVWSMLFAVFAWLLWSLTFMQALLVAIPFAVISSAVAIPSSGFLPSQGREFVVYESSISDILGILVFFALFGAGGNWGDALTQFFGGGVVSIVLGVVCALLLMFLLSHLDGHVRFMPLLAGLFLLYASGKLMHLSPLIMVLMFGLVLNNPGLFAKVPVLHRLVSGKKYLDTVCEFKSVTTELTFAVRGFFFVLLGYWTDLSSFVSLQAWMAAVVVLWIIYGVRFFLLQLLKQPWAPSLTWIAPRGLITVLLYLTVKEQIQLPHYLDGTVMLVVLVSALAIGWGRSRLQ